MNKQRSLIYSPLIRALLCVLPFSSIAHAQNLSGHTIFFPKMPFQSATPELISLFYDRMDARSPVGRTGALQIVPFVTRSRLGRDHDSNQIGTFLLPFNKDVLNTGELGSQVYENHAADLIANYFGVLTADPFIPITTPQIFNVTDLTFESRISLNPRQTIAAVGIHYVQKLTAGTKTPIWASLSFPIMQVRNEQHFCENVIDPGGGDVQPGFVGSIGAALHGQTVFHNKHFMYGKVADCALKKTGVGDIELKIGRESVHTDICVLEGYGGLVIPTGNKPQAEFIFEPVVGNNHHLGIIMGTNYSFEMWSSEFSSIWLEGVIDSRFMFENTQKRTFDLIDKQWSRYIWLYPNADAIPIIDIEPGVNFLTQQVCVHPRFAFTINTAFVFTGMHYDVELGFNRYMRQAEKVKLCNFQEGPGIAGIDFSNTDVLATANNSTMKFLAPFDTNQDGAPIFIPIQKEDINLASGAQPAMLTNIIYLALGYHNDFTEYPYFFGFGGSYEVSVDNTGLDRGMLWAKGGVSF